MSQETKAILSRLLSFCLSINPSSLLPFDHNDGGAKVGALALVCDRAKVGALKRLTLSFSKTAGRNSWGRITSFHRGGRAKRLQRRVDVKRSTSGVSVVERIEYDPNRSSRIALVRWVDGVHLRWQKDGKKVVVSDRSQVVRSDDVRPPPTPEIFPSWPMRHQYHQLKTQRGSEQSVGSSEESGLTSHFVNPPIDNWSAQSVVCKLGLSTI